MTSDLEKKIYELVRGVLEGRNPKTTATEDVEIATKAILTLFKEREAEWREEMAKKIESGKEDYMYDEGNEEHENREEIAASSYDTLGEAEQQGRNQGLGRAAALLRSTKDEPQTEI